MTTHRAEQQFDMSLLLTDMAQSLLESPNGRLANDTQRQLPESVNALRVQPLDTDDVRLIAFEAVCLLELMIGLSHAREVKDIAKAAFVSSLMIPLIREMQQDRALARLARPQ